MEACSLSYYLKSRNAAYASAAASPRIRCTAGHWPEDAARVLDPLLTEGHRKITITPPEYLEARRRREMLAFALIKEFHGQVYSTGSLVHGDAMTPLSDFDVGIVVSDRGSGYGPEGRGPSSLCERACNAIRESLHRHFPSSAVTVDGQKRAILVDFDVANMHGSFSADVIVAVPNLNGPGVLIPDLFRDGWDQSHPMAHAEMVHGAVRRIGAPFIQVVRLVKYWNRRHGMPLCSWNIKALALGCLVPWVSLTEALHIFFHTAAQALSRELTPDPAGVAPPIRLELARDEVILRLSAAVGILDRAIKYASVGAPMEAADELSLLFPDLVPDFTMLERWGSS